MKRRRFISYKDETTSFHQGSNAKKRNLFLVSNLQGGGGGGGGGFDLTCWLMLDGASGEGGRRLRFWSDERAAGRQTASRRLPCLSHEKISDFDRGFERRRLR